MKNGNYRCANCGSSGPFVPVWTSGKTDANNLAVMCANCHMQIDPGPIEIHFIQYLASLIRQHPSFSRVELEALVGEGGRVRADIVAQRRTESGIESAIVECKPFSVLSGPWLESVISQLTSYASAIRGAHIVLAFPGRASEHTLKELSRHGIEVWDIDKIADLFNEQIAVSDDPYFKSLFLNTRVRATPQEQFIRELRACPPGWESWLEYQKLIGRILSDVCSPPLSLPLSEHFDAPRANRRDFIFPNYASDGFWLFLRSRYAADYIVVDAKNGKGLATKAHVLQIANYLKEHGVGMFGIILCRAGVDGGAKVTMREQWILHRKLIVALNDLDVENMLLAKAAGGDPATVLGDRIQEFRLSM